MPPHSATLDPIWGTVAKQSGDPEQSTTIGSMPDRLYFTESDEANALIASDPMALLVGFALDQQVTVQKAFSGPLAIKERLGAIDARRSPVRTSSRLPRAPAVHRFPGSMAKKVHDLAVHVVDDYDGDAARVWTERPTRPSCARTSRASPASAR